jgi:DNA-binding response OmpR family regulator
MEQDEKTVVLVADDEPSTLAMVSSHLRSKGFSVLEASDGDQAWELAHEHLPHLVVLDVMMPGMSGWEVCRKIREAVSLAHTGVVMLTGIGENLNEMTSPLYGADAHIDKPFAFSDLDAKLSQTLRRRKAGAVGRSDEGATARGSNKKAEKRVERVERPTLPAAGGEAQRRSRARTRAESPKPPVKAKPSSRQASRRGGDIEFNARGRTANLRRPSASTRDTQTRARAKQGSAKGQVRTSIMKEKPAAKTAAKKSTAAKPASKAARASKSAPTSKAKGRAAPASKAKTGRSAPAKKATGSSKASAK